MAEITCKMYLLRGDSETGAQLWMEAEDGRAFFLPVRLDGYTNQEAEQLPHEERHRPLTPRERRSLTPVYERRGDQRFDPDAAASAGWTLGTPPKIQKTQRVYVDETRDRPFPPPANWTEYDVQYSAEPKRTFMDRSKAKDECAVLRSWNVHIGAHRCEFEVEALENGEFAITCVSHPADLKIV